MADSTPLCPDCGTALEKVEKVGQGAHWHCPECERQEAKAHSYQRMFALWGCTVRELFAWFEAKGNTVISQRRAKWRANIRRLFVERFGGKPHNEIRPCDVEAFIDSQGDVQSRSTRTAWYTTIHTVYRTAYNRHQIPFDVLQEYSRKAADPVAEPMPDAND